MLTNAWRWNTVKEIRDEYVNLKWSVVLGDGNRLPSKSDVSLQHQTFEVKSPPIKITDTSVVVTIEIPAGVANGMEFSEAGLVDGNGVLLARSVTLSSAVKYPEFLLVLTWEIVIEESLHWVVLKSSVECAHA